MNFSDSERLAAKLDEIGFKSALNDKEADLVFLNTCSVRKSAEDRVWGAVCNFHKPKLYPLEPKVIVTGCMAKRPEVVKKLVGVDIFLDIKDLDRLPQLLKVKPVAKKEVASYFSIKPKYQSAFTAYVPISTGCNNFCSYCVVPYVRGREESRPFDEVVNEVKDLVTKGYKEIWLLGQNVNSYEYDFPKLLQTINKIKGKFWIRFVSSHPKDMSDELIKVIASGGHISEYVHLALQSGDNDILKKMNRKYTRQDFIKLVSKVRKALPSAFIATDVIIGFPTETKEKFNNTVKLFKQVKFDMAYLNKYSPREGTVSYKMKDNVSKAEKKKREQILNKVLGQNALLNNKKMLGKEIEVLIYCHLGNGKYLGHDIGYRAVKVESQNNLIGKFVNVLITKADNFGLDGQLI